MTTGCTCSQPDRIQMRARSVLSIQRRDTGIRHLVSPTDIKSPASSAEKQRLERGKPFHNSCRFHE